MERLKARLFWLAVLAACALLVITAARLKPHPAGYGTHRQLTGSPCLFKYFLGVPCATCGMTTSFAHMARLQVGKAFAAQPAGALAFAGVIWLALFAAVRVIKGSTRKLRMPPDWALVLAVVCLFAGWIYKIIDSM